MTRLYALLIVLGLLVVAQAWIFSAFGGGFFENLLGSVLIAGRLLFVVALYTVPVYFVIVLATGRWVWWT